jgi:hypothetical protein
MKQLSLTAQKDLLPVRQTVLHQTDNSFWDYETKKGMSRIDFKYWSQFLFNYYSIHF